MTPEQLKASILRNAFDGKLVEQNPKEEPSINIINDIRKEQERLIKLKEIKKEKIDTSITYEEELPEGWCVAKLGELTRVVTKQTGFDYSKTIKPNLLEYKAEGTIPLVQTKNFKGKEFSLDTDYYIPINIAKDFPKILLDGKCILLSIVGASIGNVGLYTLNDLGMIGGAICKVQLINDLLYDYLYYYLQSPLGQNEIKKNYKATAQGTITVQDVREIIIKIPPLEEQRRIVAKIEDLLPYVDRYAEAYEKLEQFNAKFPEDMKKSILQYAIQGKLVEQRPEEGTAEELYQQIQEEKQRLFTEGKIKKEKPLAEIAEDEIPFDIPESWKWVHLNNIATSGLGKTLNKSTDTGEEVPYLCSINVYWEGINLDKVKTAKFDTQAKEKYRLQKGDLLICEGGEAGRSAIWDSDEEMYYQNALHRVRFYGSVDAQYMCYVLECYKKNGTIANYTKGIGIQHLVQASLNSIWLPLPPIEEQHRIVAKIEELIPLCEKLAN